MHLQIKQRLFILVIVALLALAGIAIFSYFQASRLNSALSDALIRQNLIIETVDKARGAQVRFKTQVQEWKNILLRGKDQEAFAKHLKEFNELEKVVLENLREVRQAAEKLGIAGRLNVDGVASTFEKLGPAYRDALAHYDRSGGDPAATVDKLVRGIDRAPAKAIDDLVSEVQKISDELSAAESRQAEEVFAGVRNGQILFSLLAIVVLSALAIVFVRAITGPLGELENTMTGITTNGDLTHRATIHRDDEVGRMASAFNTMMAQLQKIIGEVHGASRQVTGASTELAGSSEALAEVSEQQSNAVANSAASIEQLTVAIAAVADTAGDVERRAVESVETTDAGSAKVAMLVSEIGRILQNMGEISRTVEAFVHSTQAITGMTQEVRDIADQTNLLALNAAIEAARAGDTGRGFAVVADEVRKLAEKSAKSASEIANMTHSIMSESEAVQTAIRAGEESIQASNALAAEVEEVLAGSRQTVGHSMQGVKEIADSVGEQKIASTEIAQSMERIATMVEENNATARSISTATSQLRGLAQNLSQLVAGFRVA